MKTLTFRCSQSAKVKKSGRQGSCGRFLCEISNKIVLVCSKCGAKYSLTQEEDGRWVMAVFMESILKVNLKESKNVKT